MIENLLDNDMYKFTMMQLVYHHFPTAHVKYRFKCRNQIDLLLIRKEISRDIDKICKMEFQKKQIDFLRSQDFIKQDFADFLENFRLKREYVHVEERNQKLDIWIEGPFIQTILFEVPILKIVHENYSIMNNPLTTNLLVEGAKRLKEKIELIKTCKETEEIVISDFGTRRAYSGDWHNFVIEEMLSHHVIDGTSNLNHAMKYQIPAVGTMAHEIIQAGQSLAPNVVDSQRFILQKWQEEYKGKLAIALSDTLGMEKFLKDFDIHFAKAYDGVRHDSGDPFAWLEKMISHYQKLDIDSTTKKVVFSDGLDVPTAIALNRKCLGRIQCSFGIGTNLTNDLGVTPLQNVIKMIECNGLAVAKISDNPEKTMCENREYMEYLKSMI